MHRNHLRLTWINAILLVAALGLSLAPYATAELTVSYIEVSPQAAFTTTRVYAGTTKAARRSDLGFKRGGEVAALYADLGDAVRAGDTLAQLDTRALESNLRQAQSDALLAAANQQAAQAQTELAANTEKRIRLLRSNGNVSQQTFDEAYLQFRASKAQLAVTVAGVKRAQAHVEAMQIALSEGSITAPFDGVIQARLVDEGSQIGPGATVLRLVETGRREAHIGIPESAVAALTTDQNYVINWQGQEVNAQLRTVLPEVDPQTRTATGIFTLADERIPLGAVVELALSESVDSEGFWVPIDALTAMDRGLWGLYIVDAENTVQRRLVEIVHNDGDRAFVRGLLSARDRVVASGTQRIVPNQRVIPVPTTVSFSAR